MQAKQAQAKIAELIKADAEKAISKAIEFNLDICDIVAATRKAHGTMQGLAAIAIKNAIRDDSNEKTIANMIKFAESL